MYDQRLKPATAMVKVWKEHKQWITNVHLQRGGQRELISGCRSGEVKLWDVRMDRSVQTVMATPPTNTSTTSAMMLTTTMPTPSAPSRDTLRTLSVHEHAPVLAAGSEKHAVSVYNTSGKFLSTCEPLSSFLHQSRSSPISATAFHPHRMMLACAALNDPHINIYSVRGEGMGGSAGSGASIVAEPLLR